MVRRAVRYMVQRRRAALLLIAGVFAILVSEATGYATILAPANTLLTCGLISLLEQ